jgi:hypothetical protein
MALLRMMEDEPVNIYRSAQIFRKFLYEYREQLSASVLVAGWDAEEGGQVSVYYICLRMFSVVRDSLGRIRDSPAVHRVRQWKYLCARLPRQPLEAEYDQGGVL